MAVGFPKYKSPIFDCDSSVGLGDYVYIGTSGKLFPAKANNRATMPCIGKVIKKVSETQCRISVDWVENELTGIENEKKYFISTTQAGKLQNSPPTQAGHVLQSVAIGIGSTVRKINIDPSNFVIRS